MERLQQFIQLVHEHRADILLLQEVWQTHRHRVHEILAERLGMNAIYARTNGDRLHIGFEEGLAILSRHPLRHQGQKILRSSLHPFARRQALAALVETPCGNLLAVSTHLSINPWRNRRQVQELVEWIENQTTSAVVGGDFNTAENSSPIKLLKSRWLDTLRHIHPPECDLSTHRISIPLLGELRHRLDYLFIYQTEKIWQIVNAGNDGRYPFSDHAAVWTQLAIRG